MAVLALLGHVHLDAQATQPRTAVRRAPPAIRQRAARDGRVRVLVQFRSPSDRHLAEGFLPNAEARAAQRRALAATRGRVLGAGLPVPAGRRLLRQFATVPYVALELGPAALTALERQRRVQDVRGRPPPAGPGPDRSDDSRRPGLGDRLRRHGHDRRDPRHGRGRQPSVFRRRVSRKRAFDHGPRPATVCPDGQTSSWAPDRPPLPAERVLPRHARRRNRSGQRPALRAAILWRGQDAQILAVQVFSDFMDSATCGGPPTCTRAYSSDVIAGLEFVYSIAVQRTWRR